MCLWSNQHPAVYNGVIQCSPDITVAATALQMCAQSSCSKSRGGSPASMKSESLFCSGNQQSCAVHIVNKLNIQLHYKIDCY